MIGEEKLITQCRKGDRKAQRDLYDMYKTKWFMICLRYVKKREDALDVLQNALIKVYSKMDTFDVNKGSFSSWTSRIMVNESIMFQRKYWRPEEAPELIDNMVVANNEAGPIANLSAQELTKLIQKLPDGYRIVFNMHAIEGYTHKEIAKHLGVSEGTSKSQFFKAKRMLREQIEVII